MTDRYQLADIAHFCDYGEAAWYMIKHEDYDFELVIVPGSTESYMIYNRGRKDEKCTQSKE